MGILSLFKRNTERPRSVALPNRSGSVTLGEMATRNNADYMTDFVTLLPNPDPVLRKAGLSFVTYRELLSDEHLGAVVDSRKDAVRELEWSIDRGKARSRQTKVIEEMFSRLDVYQIITEILDAPLFGYQPMEYIWEEQNGLIQLKNIVGKPQEWFCFDTENNPRYLNPHSTNTGGDPLPDGKFVIVQHDPRYMNPYGVPLLSRVYWPVTFSKGGIKFWVTFMEKYGMPWVLASYPDNQGQTQVDELVQSLSVAVQDFIMALPESSRPEVIPNGQRASAEIYDMFIERMERRVSKAILGHGAAADSTSGKLGNEEGAMTAKWGRAASDKRLVEMVFNDAIYWAHRYNFSTGEPPTFSLWEEEDVDQATAERDVKLHSIGWRPTTEYVVKTYGMDESDFTLVEGSDPAASISFAESREAEGVEEAVEKGSRSTAIARQMVDPIQELLDTAKDYDQAFESLQKMYPKMTTDELEARLTKFMFMSDVLGRVEVGTGSADA